MVPMAAPSSPSAAAAAAAARVAASGSRDTKSHRFFVYGTLKNGFYNNALLVERRAAFMGAARTCRPMRMVLGEYGIPYLLGEDQRRGDEDEVVPGELWEVDDAGLDALDVLEGVDEGMYSRVTLDVEVWWRKKKGGEKEEEEREAAPDSTSSGSGEVVSVFGYVTGPASLERGVGSESCRAITGGYSAEVHEAEYVPKHKRAAGSLGTGGR